MDALGESSRRIRSQQSASQTADAMLPHQSDGSECDQDLVRRLLAREESAWHEFVIRFRRLILHQIHSASRELGQKQSEPSVAEDICAEIFSTLVSRDMHSLKQFHGRSRLSTWLAVVARRTALKSLGRSLRQPRQPDTGEFDMLPQSTVTDETSRQRLKKAVNESMSRLSDGDRRILNLFYHRKYSHEQLAAEFQITVNAVGPKLDRARRRLKRLVEKHGGNG